MGKMKTIQPSQLRNLPSVYLAMLAVAGLLCFPGVMSASWLREADTLTWQQDGHVLWQLNFDDPKGKPFFHPLTADGAHALTTARPSDHPWHYGLWFSWKYINKVNYWEHNRQTGAPEGRTRWQEPRIRTREDGSAKIRFKLDYVHPSGRIDLKESRRLVISAPSSDGSYTIDWEAEFVAGPEGAKLDRTPMPGEPKGQVNGGYAGLSFRMAGAPVQVSYVNEKEPVTEFRSNRARPDARSLASNFELEGKIVGAVAVLSDPANVKGSSPWYAIKAEQMRFFCSAILAPKPLELKAGEKLSLRYRIIVRRTAWTSADLRAALADWK